MRDFDIRFRLRSGWTLEQDEGRPFLRSPEGERVYDRTLAPAIARMSRGGKYAMLKEVDSGFHHRRWELT